MAPPKPIPHGIAGCSLYQLILVLAVFLTIQSTNVQDQKAPLCPHRSLGAGFPFTYLCDDAAGSPTSSMNKIDSADWYDGKVIFLRPHLFFGDVLFYAVLLWIPWLLVWYVAGLIRRTPAPTEQIGTD